MATVTVARHLARLDPVAYVTMENRTASAIKDGGGSVRGRPNRSLPPNGRSDFVVWIRRDPPVADRVEDERGRLRQRKPRCGATVFRACESRRHRTGARRVLGALRGRQAQARAGPRPRPDRRDRPPSQFPRGSARAADGLSREPEPSGRRKRVDGRRRPYRRPEARFASLPIELRIRRIMLVKSTG